jgi:hypothetical protein
MVVEFQDWHHFITTEYDHLVCMLGLLNRYISKRYLL